MKKCQRDSDVIQNDENSQNNLNNNENQDDVDTFYDLGGEILFADQPVDPYRDDQADEGEPAMDEDNRGGCVDQIQQRRLNLTPAVRAG